MAKKVLVVDDEKDIVELLKFSLEEANFAVSAAYDGEAALQKIKKEPPDLVILDIMLPKLDGIKVCQKIRSNPRTEYVPIIMLTIKDGEIDKILGLEMGADDYVPKPFSPRELVARVKAVLRRSEVPLKKRKVFQEGGLRLDVAERRVFLEGKCIPMTYTEFELLRFLMQNKGLVLSRATLLEQVWGYDYFATTRTVDVYIRRLRKKIGPSRIETIREVGYRFMD